MSIYSEISRLKTVKEDMKNAIIAKGGTVNGTLDTFANAIENLPSGGEEYNGLKKLIERDFVDYQIPTGVTNISRYCFIHSNLNSITIPNSVTSISTEAFIQCTSLKTVIWNSTQQFLPASVFRNCFSLETLDLSSATKIFRFGTSATSMELGTEGYIHIHSGLKIIVPKSLFDSWRKSTYWANFVSYIYYRDDDGTLKQELEISNDGMD